jgi:hypothetical protein
MPRAALLLLALSACGGPGALELGAPVDPAHALPMSEALALPAGSEVTLKGSVAEVCTSAGCWFVLRSVEGDDLRDLYVDLQPTTMRLDPSAVGRAALVRGKLAGEEPDRELQALGLRLE